MPPSSSDDFGATAFDPLHPGVRSVHDHLFPGANTGLASLLDDAPKVKREQEFLTGVTRIDLIGVKEGGTIDSPFTLVRPTIPSLTPGKTYLLEVVVRTLKVGHLFTQGTADSNEVWTDLQATSASQAADSAMKVSLNQRPVALPRHDAAPACDAALSEASVLPQNLGSARTGRALRSSVVVVE